MPTVSLGLTGSARGMEVLGGYKLLQAKTDVDLLSSEEAKGSAGSL